MIVSSCSWDIQSRTHKPTTTEQCGSREKKIKDVLVYDPIQPTAFGKPSLRS